VFEDNERNIIIKTIDATTEKATFELSYQKLSCVRSQPSLWVGPPGPYGGAGETLTYKYYVTNNDNANCGNSTYEITPKMPDGLTISDQKLTITVAPGTGAGGEFTVTSAPTLADGAYSFTLTARNTGVTGDYSASYTVNYNVFSADTNPPTVKIIGISEGQVLTGRDRVSLRNYANDPNGISLMTVYINNQTVKTCRNKTTCDYAISASKLSAGSHVVRVEAVDKDTAPRTGSASINFVVE
ncbi:hypothetical protein K0A96_00805, partial [Patescibacteria group bacterium]|nr:hypothetical protein [Patescibacteria group bacterium]